METPHNQEAKTNKKIENKNNLTSPKYLASHPDKGIEMALDTANDVITHVAWLVDVPRFPAIVESATLAIVKSKICKKATVANATISPINFAPDRYNGDIL